jgi:hypothetical protein
MISIYHGSTIVNYVHRLRSYCDCCDVRRLAFLRIDTKVIQFMYSLISLKLVERSRNARQGIAIAGRVELRNAKIESDPVSLPL